MHSGYRSAVYAPVWKIQISRIHCCEHLVGEARSNPFCGKET
jgi:hypothetical protein